MDYFIGIDIGTSSARAVAFSIDGKVLVQHAVPYGISHPQANWSEQDPNEINEAVLKSIDVIATGLAGHQPLLISFSAPLHSLMVVGEDGAPLTKCIIWADNRAAEIAETLRPTENGKSFYQKTGVPIHAMSPLCKLVWLKNNQPDIFSNASKFIGIKEFIFHSLFGKYIVDTGIASATGLLNIYTLEWDETILAFAGITKGRLSQLVSTHHIEFLHCAHSLALRLPILAKTAFVVGGSDGALANFGSGAMDQGSMAITVGTSSAARMVTREVYIDDQMRTFCYHLKDDFYICGGASNNGGIVLQWLKENILEDGNTVEEFFNLAAMVAPGCDNLLFLPYILGERAPLWNSNARGIFFGLSVTHGKGHLVRAAMEAVIYNLYSIGKILMERIPATIIFANGGFANSSLWIQMLADMFNVPVFVNDIEESSAWGAVMVGMEAIGTKPGQRLITAGKKYKPNRDNHMIYKNSFEKFERIYGLVKSEFVSSPVSVLESSASNQ